MQDRHVPDCKAHPDEKGIETDIHRLLADAGEPIAKPIPMKRELKREGLSVAVRS